MLTLSNLSQQIAECRRGDISLDDFEDWFRDNSRGAYSVSEVSDACASIEAAFSKFYFQGLDEGALKAELANAVRPVAERLREEPPVMAVANNGTLWYSIDSSDAAVGRVRSGSATKITRKPPASSANSAGFPRELHEALM